MAIKNTFYIWCVIASLLVSCTHSVRTESQPEGLSAGTPMPNAAEGPRKTYERGHITLVFGGAGVASFATIGILKRLKEEDIEIDAIVTSGWPTLFSLAYSFLKSVHDLEWFGMRLSEKDFYSSSIFDMRTGYAAHDKISQLIEKNFTQKDLTEAKVPIIIAATNTEQTESTDIYDKGDWREPLLKTMSVPGMYRPYPDSGGTPSINALQGLSVDEAVKRGAKLVVAVEMYSDYLNFLRPKGEGSDQLFRKLFLNQLRTSIAKQLKQAPIQSHIQLSRSPGDFSAKRNAIQLGYQEGGRLAKEIRRELHLD